MARKLESDRRVLGNDHPATIRSIDVVTRVLLDEGKFAQAEPLLSEVLAIRKAKLGPDHPDTLLNMCDVAASLNELSRGAEAIRVIDDCLERAARKIVERRLIQGITNVRPRHFEKAKDADGCRETAEMWENLNRTDAASLYDSACRRAVVAAVLKRDPRIAAVDASRLAVDESDRAMIWLTKAVAAGFKDAAHLAKDKDLDALRHREDFKSLMSKLCAKR